MPALNRFDLAVHASKQVKRLSSQSSMPAAAQIAVPALTRFNLAVNDRNPNRDEGAGQIAGVLA